MGKKCVLKFSEAKMSDFLIHIPQGSFISEIQFLDRDVP